MSLIQKIVGGLCVLNIILLYVMIGLALVYGWC